ncbi:putative sporulation protein YyaC [Natranaerovirga pectinivora]|uniref:Putative sporulation protein YyaC n=1 Tax=Natranaerovirga pectinivora TaxID=682400 RepID=A0A4V2UZR4_9FIRM|nr:spore protease YyaC [Natranaerovirga pectinivora]TCT12305.1 putative sporulation protein YyaC [Natranaerovirga pectinivora]
MNFLKQSSKKTFSFDVNEINNSSEFGSVLYYLILKNAGYLQPIVFLCIGTDRATGDSLGPLTGYKLEKSGLHNVHIYGTLDQPVHAKNIEETIDKVYALYKNPFIVAIDACLGKMDHIGYVNLGEGSIKPGAGVNKKLPSVGDLYITGIVNFSGFMDMLILQNTRLNIVMKMADFICEGISTAYLKLNSNTIHSENFSTFVKQV